MQSMVNEKQANPNDRQVGGDHYREHSVDYQHWDLMIDCFGPDYLIGVATKYLARYRESGKGRMDLEKSVHYQEKLISLCVPGGKLAHSLPTERAIPNFARFASEHKLSRDMVQIFHLLLGYTSVAELFLAKKLTEKLLAELPRLP